MSLITQGFGKHQNIITLGLGFWKKSYKKINNGLIKIRFELSLDKTGKKINKYIY